MPDTRPSSPPQSASEPERASSGVVERPRPTTEDLWFVNELSAAGLLDELGGDELSSIAGRLGDAAGLGRQLQILTEYYAATGDPFAADRRRRADRYVAVGNEEPLTARQIVERVGQVAVEIGAIRLERIGADDGPLVLRTADHMAAVVDEYEESLDTGEIDLRDLDEGQTVTVRGIVHAINVLLDRAGVEARLVPLLGSIESEIYVGVGPTAALALQAAGLLELEEPDELMEHAAW